VKSADRERRIREEVAAQMLAADRAAVELARRALAPQRRPGL